MGTQTKVQSSTILGIQRTSDLVHTNFRQDIDYLPEKGVDYSDCDVPMQLSAEIAPGIEASQGLKAHS